MMEFEAREKALRDMLVERNAQSAKWGEESLYLSAVEWLAVLTEEVGGLAQATLADRFGAEQHSSHSGPMYEEATHVAAVALQILEYLNRREGNR